MTTKSPEPQGSSASILDSLERGREAAAGERGSEATIQLIVLKIGAELCCVRVDEIEHIAPMGQVATVPGAAAHVLGVTNHRGEIVPVIDLTRLIGIGDGSRSAEPMIMVALVDGVTSGVGCVIDELVDIWSRPVSDVQPPLATLQGGAMKFVEGVIEVDGKLVPLLQLRGLVAGGDGE